VFFVLSGAWLGSTERYPLRFHVYSPANEMSLECVLRRRWTGRDVNEMWLISYTKARKEVGGGSTVAISSWEADIQQNFGSAAWQCGLATWLGRSLWVSGAESFIP
jgi:hypothetical protein